VVIWMKGSASQMGAEDGVLRAADVQKLLSLDALRQQLHDQQEALIGAARAQAEAIVTEAQREAQALREGTAAQVEAAVKAGFDEGRKRNAMEWHELQARQALNKSQALRLMHEKLAVIVTSAVERIVHTEQRDALYQRALRNVQTLTRGATQLTLRVGPADFEAATRGVAEARQHAPDGIRLEVVVDPGLKPGSCIFESELGILDASLETQLDALRVAMRRAVNKALVDSPEEADELFARADADAEAPSSTPIGETAQQESAAAEAAPA
jgi:type III secretion protein L